MGSYGTFVGLLVSRLYSGESGVGTVGGPALTCLHTTMRIRPENPLAVPPLLSFPHPATALPLGPVLACPSYRGPPPLDGMPSLSGILSFLSPMTLMLGVVPGLLSDPVRPIPAS